MNLKIEVLGQKAQLFNVIQNSQVLDIIEMIIKSKKLGEQNQQLGLYHNGIELKKEQRLNAAIYSMGILQLKKKQQIVKQLEGIKLYYNKQVKIAYVYFDDSNNILYDQAEKQFSLSKDSFKLILKDQVLEKLTPLKQNNIDASSTIEVKLLGQSQFNQQKQMIELKLKYQQDYKNISFDLYGKIFELEVKAKALFCINEDICILNDNKVLQPDQKLIDADLDKKYCLEIVSKEQYSKSLSFININIECNNQIIPLEISTDTLISEIITLLEIQQNLTNIDLRMNTQVLPTNQTISQLNIKNNSKLDVISKLNNILKLNLRIGSNTEQIEIQNDTIIQELISQIESNFQLQNIELVLPNGQTLHKNLSLMQQNIQNGTYLQVQCFNPIQNKQQTGKDLNSTIQVFVQYQQQTFQYQIRNNQVIQDIEKAIRVQLNCQNKIQLVYQNKILNLQNTFAQEGITNGCQLQCNLLIEKIEEKIKIKQAPEIQDPLIKIIILFENQQKEKLIRGNTLVEALIQTTKSQFSLDQDIYFTHQGKTLNPQQTLKENEIQEKSQLVVHFSNVKLVIKYKDFEGTLEVSVDILVEELMRELKQKYHIKNDFDILINGTTMNPKQYLKGLKLKNLSCLEIQEKLAIQEQKKIKNFKIIEEYPCQSNQQNQQFQQQQGYSQIPQYQNNQINQQTPLISQSQQKNEKVEQQSIVQFQTSSIIIKEVILTQNNQQIPVSIKISGNNIEREIEFQLETKIYEIMDYMANSKEFNLGSYIKLIFKGKVLQPNQTLKEIDIKNNDIIYAQQNGGY